MLTIVIFMLIALAVIIVVGFFVMLFMSIVLEILDVLVNGFCNWDFKQQEKALKKDKEKNLKLDYKEDALSMENPPESYLTSLKNVHIKNVYYDPKSDCYYPDSRKH